MEGDDDDDVMGPLVRSSDDDDNDDGLFPSKGIPPNAFPVFSCFMPDSHVVIISCDEPESSMLLPPIVSLAVGMMVMEGHPLSPWRLFIWWRSRF